jgi:hypothetical protein
MFAGINMPSRGSMIHGPVPLGAVLEHRLRGKVLALVALGNTREVGVHPGLGDVTEVEARGRQLIPEVDTLGAAARRAPTGLDRDRVLFPAARGAARAKRGERERSQ